jgi:hypothetical protein
LRNLRLCSLSSKAAYTLGWINSASAVYSEKQRDENDELRTARIKGPDVIALKHFRSSETPCRRQNCGPIIYYTDAERAPSLPHASLVFEM